MTLIPQENFEEFSESGWAWLSRRMTGATVHICCREIIEDEDPDHVYIYLNRKHRNGSAFRWYMNGLTPDLYEISKGIEADVYSIPSVFKDSDFYESIKDQKFAYLNHFYLLAKLYPSLEDSYTRRIKDLPTTGISAILLCNALPIEKCIIHDLDLYYPHYKDYKRNPQGKNPPHSLEFDLSCLDLIEDTKFEVISRNPEVLKKFTKKTRVETAREKNALLLVSDDGFAVPATFFIHNFIEKNPWFEGDVIIAHSSNIVPLSEESQELIKMCGYPSIKFHKIPDDKEAYAKEVVSGFLSKGGGCHKRTTPSIFTLEIFNNELWGAKYDKTILLDADMLVLDSIEDVFNTEDVITVTEDTTFVYPENNPDRTKGGKQFNGGFILVNHKKLAEYPIDLSFCIYEFCRNYTKAPSLFEQSIMNDFFAHLRKILPAARFDADIAFAPDRTQMLKRCLPDTHLGHYTKAGRIPENTYNKSFASSGAKIIHYVGSKPWQFVTRDYEANYQKIEKLWFEAFKEFYSSNKEFAESDIFKKFLKNNPRLMKSGKSLKFLPPTKANRVRQPELSRNAILKILKTEKSYEQGRIIYEQAVMEYPNWPALKREYGLCLVRFGRKGDEVTAFNLFCGAFKGNPRSAAAASAAAASAIRLKNNQDAICYIRHVRELKPNCKKLREIEIQFRDAFLVKKGR